MKKALSLILVVILTMGLCACGGSANTASPTPAAQPADSTPAPADNAPAEPTPAEEAWKPEGEFTILIPYAVSSAQDIPFRMVAQYLSDTTGLSFTVENDEAGGGARLADMLANAGGDGMTIMFAGANKCAQYYQDFWDFTLSDTSKVKVAANVPGPDPYCGTVLCVRNGFPATSIDEFIEYVNAHPGEVTMGISVGKASEAKCKSLFNYLDLNDKVRFVSAGNDEMLTGLMGGTIDCGMLTEGTSTSTGYAVNGDFQIIFNYRLDRNYTDEKYHYSQEELDILDSVKILPDIMSQEDAESVYCLFKNYAFVSGNTPDDVVEAVGKLIESIGESDEYMDQFHALSGGNDLYTSEFSEYAKEVEIADEQCRIVYGNG